MYLLEDRTDTCMTKRLLEVGSRPVVESGQRRVAVVPSDEQYATAKTVKARLYYPKRETCAQVLGVPQSRPHWCLHDSS